MVDASTGIDLRTVKYRKEELYLHSTSPLHARKLYYTNIRSVKKKDAFAHI
jgi:hypothetical protein